MRKETMDGNMASAYVSYALTEVAAIYPITPSSPMAEAVDKWSAEGKKNIFGQAVRLMEMQSEGGAAGAMHGSLQGGALTTTYTSSQGLLLMIPNIYKITGELLPGVFHVSARSLASNALSIFGDHQDVMSIRQTGISLLSSGNVQECMDLGAVAHLAAISSRVPVVHFFDGFRTSHEIQKIAVLEYEDIRKMLDYPAVSGFRERALNPDHPVLRGTTQNPDIFFQVREATNKFYSGLAEQIQSYMDRVNHITGKDYKLFNYYGAKDALQVIVAMGSSCDVIRETIEYLNAAGGRYGLVQVHLYRPFSTKHLLAAFPESVQKVVVLDRTKEPGASGEPLYLDVRNAFFEVLNHPVIIGGRYGLASKDFRPEDVMAILENLDSNHPKNGFTVGIKDDVTHLSLNPSQKVIDASAFGTTQCKFWGLGSDGTVSANKSAIKIIGDHTDKYVQAYFAYDSKKSGGLTVSHLRFGEKQILSSYLVNQADYIACHNQTYVKQYDLLESIKEGGIFLLNCAWDRMKLAEELPPALISTIIEKKIWFYTINAFAIAKKIGLGLRINMMMQSAFFQLTKIIPQEDALLYLKEEVEKNYGHQGQAVVDKNYQAIDCVVSNLCLIQLNTEDLAKAVSRSETKAEIEAGKLPDFVERIVVPMNRQKGDSLPVSTFDGIEDGTYPTGTTKYEKRGIAVEIPKWDSESCIQCSKCAFSCPHAVLRPMLLTGQQIADAPEELSVKKANGHYNYLYYMGFSALDCTGCGNCVEVCPAKGKALGMVPLSGNIDKMEAEWDYVKDLEPTTDTKENIRTVKESQFLKPYFEFSGACAGCGETPYAKLITQLYGDRMMISNSAGCTTVWGGSAPAIPFTKDSKGHGPAWGFSLFEDNAEYGLGMYLGYSTVRNRLKCILEEVTESCKSEKLRECIGEWLSGYAEGKGTRQRSERLISVMKEHLDVPEVGEVYNRKDYLIKRSNWIFGGDGWAYDIGFGGLDHVVSTGADINVMIFDTEVYSNTGGQSSKSTPRAAIAKFAAAGKQNRKKDLGMMLMHYEDIYVAQVAMGADRQQTLQAIIEAEAYPGPAIIIGYAPCVNHGIKGGMGKSQYQQKCAVESGYWSLYRHNPKLREENKNPFHLDSPAATLDFEEFLMSEVRFSSLAKKEPELADKLFAQAKEDALKRYINYKKMSDMVTVRP